MRRDVLETSTYPEIAYRADGRRRPSRSRRAGIRLRIGGRLSLHGVTRPHRIDAELLVFDDGVRLRRRGVRCGCPTTGSGR